MRKALAIAGILALSIAPTASFADHLQLDRETERRMMERRGSLNLSHTNLSGLSLSHANLSGANLRDADLSDADLSDADLSDADLSDAGLSGADLRNANLFRADLTNANLRSADLSGAELTSITATNLRGCPRSLPRLWACENNSLFRR